MSSHRPKRVANLWTDYDLYILWTDYDLYIFVLNCLSVNSTVLSGPSPVLFVNLNVVDVTCKFFPQCALRRFYFANLDVVSVICKIC
jgi:hypothetical protein